MRTTGRKGESASLLSRGWMGSGSSDLESECGYSGEFRPLSRPERTRWRRVCASRGPGDRRRRRRRRGLRRTAGGSGAGLTGIGSRRFPPPGKGGKVPVQPHPERGGKCQFSPTRKGGESAIFGAGGDQPPLATSRRCCLAAARLCVPPSAPRRRSWRLSRSVSGPAGAVLTGDQGWIKYIIVPFSDPLPVWINTPTKEEFQLVTVEDFYRRCLQGTKPRLGQVASKHGSRGRRRIVGGRKRATLWDRLRGD